MVAMMVNMMSALSSGFTILFLFWSITLLAKKIVAPERRNDNAKMYMVHPRCLTVIGFPGLYLHRSFWFSAVEGEVYAMSSLMTALVFWAILKWDEVADEKHSFRWLILIAFVIGLSIGVHLLNLLAIPAISLVYYFKKLQALTLGRRSLTLAVSRSLILAFIMYLIIPWIVKLSGLVRTLFVNSFGLPFNSGTMFFFVLLIGLSSGDSGSRKEGESVLNTVRSSD